MIVDRYICIYDNYSTYALLVTDFSFSFFINIH